MTVPIDPVLDPPEEVKITVEPPVDKLVPKLLFACKVIVKVSLDCTTDDVKETIESFAEIIRGLTVRSTVAILDEPSVPKALIVYVVKVAGLVGVPLISQLLPTGEIKRPLESNGEISQITAGGPEFKKLNEEIRLLSVYI